MGTKIWATTKTGFTVHSFNNGVAECRKNIKQGPGAALSHADARTWVLGTPGLSFCTSCESWAEVHEALVDSEHAIALAMNEEFDAQAAPACDCPPSYAANDYHETPCPMYVHPKSATEQETAPVMGEEFDAKAAPVCTCTNHPGFQKHGYHLATCPTDSEENDDVTIKDGPLTERQIFIINRLRAGKRHEEIAKSWATVPGGGEEPRTITVSVIKQECQTITAKFGTATVMQAVSLWATAQAYRETATLIGSHRPSHVDDETDVHVDHVLYGLVQILRERADRLTPQ